MKKTMTVLLALTLIFTLCGLTAAKEESEKAHPFKDQIRATESEPNDDCATADALTVGDPMAASIAPVGDNDWFEFQAYAGQCVSFQTAPGVGQTGGDTRLYLWESDCVTQAGFDDDGGDGLYSLLGVTFAVGGTYYIQIDEYNNDAEIGAYVLTVDACPPPPEDDGSICDFRDVCFDWDFALGDHGFLPAECGGGAPVWEYGNTTFVPGAPGTVWGTILEGDYVVLAGDALVSPPFDVVVGQCDYMEVRHYVHTERYSETSTLWDGCNVSVGGVVIPPLEGYSGTASTSALCVGGQEVLGGRSAEGPLRNWNRSCFDLTAFDGQTVQLNFNFGSDGSVVYPGWYLAYVKVGTTEEPIANEDLTWGSLKALYR